MLQTITYYICSCYRHSVCKYSIVKQSNTKDLSSSCPEHYEYTRVMEILFHRLVRTHTNHSLQSHILTLHNVDRYIHRILLLTKHTNKNESRQCHICVTLQEQRYTRLSTMVVIHKLNASRNTIRYKHCCH
jgi:hypothetical protein